LLFVAYRYPSPTRRARRIVGGKRRTISRFTRSPGCGDSPCFLNMVQPISLFSGRHISSESGVRGCSQLGIIKRDPETHPTGNPRTNLKRHSQQPPSRTRNAPFTLIPHITMQFCHRRSDSSIDAGVTYGTGVREGVRRRPVRQSICRSMPMTKSHFSYVQARTFSPFSLLFPSICLICLICRLPECCHFLSAVASGGHRLFSSA